MNISIIIASLVTIVAMAYPPVSGADQGDKRDSSMKQTPYEEGSVKQKVEKKGTKKKEVKRKEVKDNADGRSEPSRLPDPCRMSSPPPECLQHQ